ncbi:hypothetical protein BGX23_002092, partial [Mortierella sp. AD031]
MPTSNASPVNPVFTEQPSAVPAMTFRAHHLKAQELKHTQSFSSMSSYASSAHTDTESAPNSSSEEERPTTKKQQHSGPVSTQKGKRRPGGGSTLRPAGKAHDWYSGGRITSNGRWFRDSQNRTLLLRGVNL